MRKTKIICTVGPASENEETLTAMCLAGMNVARLNLSHGTHEEHRRKIGLITRVREKLGLPIAILLDTKGPEYRIGTFANGSVTVNAGDTFTFTTDEVEGNEHIVSVNYKDLVKNLSIGDRILVCNGLVIFEVTALSGNHAICKVLIGGVMSDRKSMSFPNKVMSGPYLSDRDKADLLFAIENDVDFIAASFVSGKEDLEELHAFLDANGGQKIDIIAKIENRSGVDNMEQICELCEGILIARGDLGVEIPFVEVPAVQKMLTEKCRLLGKRVILATEMLESMVCNPRPTRAEISDVANAVYDGISAVLLSGETAAGKYPVESVQIMAQVAGYTEQQTAYKHRFMTSAFHISDLMDAVSHTACAMAVDVDAKAIVVCSVSGKTAMMVSRFLAPVDIIGLTTDTKVWRKLSLSWGVTPVMTEAFNDMDIMFKSAQAAAGKTLGLQPGDHIVLTGGPINGKSGNTNTIKVEII